MRGRPQLAEPDEDPETLKIRPRSRSLDDLVLKLLHEEEARDVPVTQTGPYAMVLSVALGSCQVLFEDRLLNCKLTSELRQRQQTALAVGDHVFVDFERGNDPIVASVLPRHTRLSRPDPGIQARERVIVANVDQVGIVVSLVTPPLHPRLIDRYLIAIQKGGAKPLLCVNKIDLVEDQSELSKLQPYRDLGLHMVLCSADSGEGLDDLRQHLRGRLTAFVGHSGVGKSSLLNALRPDLGLATGEVSAGYGRGTHTTTSSSLHDLGDGLRIIDTPGVREFGLWQVSAQELDDSFPEFSSLTCRFRDCTHTHEPGCGVKEATDLGQITSDRLETYQSLRAALDSR